MLRCQIRQQQPERLSLTLGLEIPQGIDHGADGHVHNALFRAEPAQLRVIDEFAPGASQIAQERFDVTTEEVAEESSDRSNLDIVSAPDREDKTMAYQSIRTIGVNLEVAR